MNKGGFKSGSFCELWDKGSIKSRLLILRLECNDFGTNYFKAQYISFFILLEFITPKLAFRNSKHLADKSRYILQTCFSRLLKTGQGKYIAGGKESLRWHEKEYIEIITELGKHITKPKDPLERMTQSPLLGWWS